MPIQFIGSISCCGRSGSSIGWVVTQSWSLMYSDGGRLRCGISSRLRMPLLVQPPGERRQPAEAALDHHDLQLREALEHAFQDQAGHHRLAGGRMAGHLLDVVGRPAGSRDGIAAIAEDMDADRQAVPRRGLVDRPVAAAAEAARWSGSGSAPARSAGSPARRSISSRASWRVIVGHHDRGLAARSSWRVQAVQLPVVDGSRHRGAEVGVLVALAGDLSGLRIAVLDAVGVEVVLAHECEIAARPEAFGRPGIAAAGARRCLGIGIDLPEAVARAPVGRADDATSGR